MPETSEVDLISPTNAPTRYGFHRDETLILMWMRLPFSKTTSLTATSPRVTRSRAYDSPRIDLSASARIEFGIGTLGTDVPWDESLSELRLSRHCDVEGRGLSSGAHLLPYFRAAAQLGAATFVLGDLYGAAHHGLILPLYKPEIC